MKFRLPSMALGMGLVLGVAAWGQGPPGSAGNTSTARVETIPVELIPPERYQVPLVLEPSRRVWIMATDDGVLRNVAVPIGGTVKEGQEIAQLDRLEATAKLKIAQAEVKEKQVQVKGAQKGFEDVAEAQLEASQARAEVAKLALERCTLRAPFGGRVLSVPVSTGQFAAKGTTLVELADVSSLNVLVPVDRGAVTSGGAIDLSVEGKTVKGKVLTVLPLPAGYAVLRELVTPWAGAWVSVPNTNNELEPGQRVRNPYLPATPITTLPARSIRNAREGDGIVQVIRQEYVYDIPVRVMGQNGPERLQVTGAFRRNDAVIVESSIALSAGTFVRFSGGGTPSADVTPPVGGGGGGGRVAPIGSPDLNVNAGDEPPARGKRPLFSRPSGGGGSASPPPANKPAAKKKAGGDGSVPF